MKFLSLIFVVITVFLSNSLLAAEKSPAKKVESNPMTLERLKSLSSSADGKPSMQAMQGTCYPYACWGKIQAVDMWGGNFYRLQLDLPYTEIQKANCTRAQNNYYPTFTLATSHPKADAIQQALVHSINTENYAWVDFATGSSDCNIYGVRIFKL